MTQCDTLELAIIADVHYVCKAEHICPIPERNAHLGRELLRRALRRIQLSGAPDALVLMGDLVDDGRAPGAEHDLAALKEELENVGVPTIVVPGNHDGAPERLLRIFGDRPGVHEVKGYLLITFADRYDSDDRAERSQEGLALVRDVASSHPGAPLIVFQHNPVYPPIESSYPYNLTNASEVMKVYSENGVVLSVSGHLHSGHKLICADDVGYIICPALCEDPFRFLRIKVRGGEISVQEEALKMPKEPPLVDVHVHTQYAYCATTVTAQGAIERARKLGLSGIVLTEHAGHLYVSPKDSGRIIEKPQLLRRYRSEGRDRMRAYRKEMEALRSSFVRLGLEVECDRNGELSLLEEDREGWDLLVGAVHMLPEAYSENVERGFMMVTEKLLQRGVKVLAHPFRLFRRHGMETPRHLFRPMAKLLAAYGVAAELNFHTNEPDPEFFRLCLEEGVPIALGSDAHALYEVGEFAPHIEFLRKLAVEGNLKNILFYP
ncbi:MAG: hypothetical protein DRN21_03970 [Thermoplasmata archaeon]|nr:MAG: hypothetical protein DRN21_03970 [Thermoplasmata archaeon]